MTFGETLVGISFNPAQDEKVAKAKSLCAELTDLLLGHAKDKELSDLEEILFQHSIGEILNAQMNVVKFLTFRK